MDQAEQSAQNPAAPVKRKRRMTREPTAMSASLATRPRPTKGVLVERLLAAKGGATLAALCNATAWQPHTCRAFLTRLRQAGKPLVRRTQEDGTSAYHLVDEAGGR